MKTCWIYWPTLTLLQSQGLLQREKGPEVHSLDQLLKQKNVPDTQQEAFKTGFTEGFMRSQAFTQRTQGMCWVVSCFRFSLGGSAEFKPKTPVGDINNLRPPPVLTDSLKRTRLILLVLLLLGIYGLSRTPFLSGKGSFSDAGLCQFLFFPMLANQPTPWHTHCKYSDTAELCSVC